MKKEKPLKLKIVDNRSKCRLCGDVIVSTHHYDFVRCKCGEIFVDGGREYTRRGASDLNNIIEMTVYEDEDGNEYTFEQAVKIRNAIVP